MAWRLRPDAGARHGFPRGPQPCLCRYRRVLGSHERASQRHRTCGRKDKNVHDREQTSIQAGEASPLEGVGV
jgi:hypothetical protein